MTVDEMKKILAYLRVSYPKSFEHLKTLEDEEMYLNVWYDIFREEDARLVMAAVRKAVSDNFTGFAPPIGVIRNVMVDLTAAGSMPAEEAWKIARSFWSSIGSDDPREIRADWEQLPESIKRIYQPEDMVELGFRMSSHEVDAFEKPRFMKAWAEEEKRQRSSVLRLPSISRYALETTGRLMIEHVSE